MSYKRYDFEYDSVNLPNSLERAFKNHFSGEDLNALKVFLVDISGGDRSTDTVLKEFQQSYVGNFFTLEEFAREYCDDFMREIPQAIYDVLNWSDIFEVIEDDFIIAEADKYYEGYYVFQPGLIG